jgi:hypothetical protein
MAFVAPLLSNVACLRADEKSDRTGNKRVTFPVQRATEIVPILEV